MAAKAVNISTIPVNRKVRINPTFSFHLLNRVRLCAKYKGLRDMDVIRVAVDKYLVEQNF